jgi:hypothetical protein
LDADFLSSIQHPKVFLGLTSPRSGCYFNTGFVAGGKATQ